MLISYAQNFEDVMLWRALRHVSKGFYIDIGAQDPVVDSVSLAFYDQGWRGVHVEPVKKYAEKLRAARVDEDVLQVAICAHTGRNRFFEIPDTGLSTSIGENARKRELAGYALQETEVACITLAALLDTYKEKELHWLKIDIEGMEEEAIKGWPPSEVRPWIVVVESLDPITLRPSHMGWEQTLKALGYVFAHFDGLNRFYVSEGRPDLLPAFENGPSVFDNFSLSGTATAPFCLTTINQLHQSGGIYALVRETNRSTIAYTTEVRQVLDLQKAEFEDLRVRAAKLEEELATRTQEAAANGMDAAVALAKLQVAEQDLRGARVEGLAAGYRCNVSRARAAALELEISRYQCDCRSLAQQLGAGLGERDAARAELIALSASRSWRLTQRLHYASAVSNGLRAKMGRGYRHCFGLLRRRAGGLLELLLRGYRVSPIVKISANVLLRRSPLLAAHLAAFARSRSRAVANEPLNIHAHGGPEGTILQSVNQSTAKLMEQLRAHRPSAERGSW